MEYSDNELRALAQEWTRVRRKYKTMTALAVTLAIGGCVCLVWAIIAHWPIRALLASTIILALALTMFANLVLVYRQMRAIAYKIKPFIRQHLLNEGDTDFADRFK